MFLGFVIPQQKRKGGGKEGYLTQISRVDMGMELGITIRWCFFWSLSGKGGGVCSIWQMTKWETKASPSPYLIAISSSLPLPYYIYISTPPLSLSPIFPHQSHISQ